MIIQFNKSWCSLLILYCIQLFVALPVNAQNKATGSGVSGFLVFLLIILLIVLGIALSISVKAKELVRENKKKKATVKEEDLSNYLQNLDSRQIEIFLKKKHHASEILDTQKTNSVFNSKSVSLSIISILITTAVFAQDSAGQAGSLLSEKGILVTITLILTPILIGILLMFLKVRRLLRQYRNKRIQEEAERLANYISSLNNGEIVAALEKRKAALDYQLSHTELSGSLPAVDEKGMISNAGPASGLTFVAIKKKAVKRPNIDPHLSKLILWYIGSAAFWLLFGTTIGEYLGIKFVSPDADHISWLSFGRLRPVHTNAVFWGWASLGMLGLGYYIVPTVSNTALASIKKGWYALFLINAAVVLGTVLLMAGINNGGGEYREYIWPVMLLFAIGVALTLINFLQTIAKL